MFTQLAYEFNKNPELDDDEGYQEISTVSCPFDSSHMMQPKNYLTHIYRCKSPNKHLYVQCRYDPCHWFYPEEKDKHHQTCPTRLEHYMDIDMEQGDWDDQEIHQKMQHKANKEKHAKRKQKILKIMAYLRLKKKLQQQNKPHKTHQNNKNLTTTAQSTNQNQSDATTTYSELKYKMLNMFKKNKNKINQSLETSKAQSELNFGKKDQSFDNCTNLMMNAAQYPMLANLPYQYLYHPMNPLVSMAQPPFTQPGMLGPNRIPVNPLNDEQYQQFQQYHQLQHQLGYQPNLMLPRPPLTVSNGINYPPFAQPQYPFMNPAYPIYPYQQAYQMPLPPKSKPQPQESLKFEVNVNTQSFVKKKFFQDDSKSLNSETKTKVSSQFDAHSVLLSEKRNNFISILDDKQIKPQQQLTKPIPQYKKPLQKQAKQNKTITEKGPRQSRQISKSPISKLLEKLEKSSSKSKKHKKRKQSVKSSDFEKSISEQKDKKSKKQKKQKKEKKNKKQKESKKEKQKEKEKDKSKQKPKKKSSQNGQKSKLKFIEKDRKQKERQRSTNERHEKSQTKDGKSKKAEDMNKTNRKSGNPSKVVNNNAGKLSQRVLQTQSLPQQQIINHPYDQQISYQYLVDSPPAITYPYQQCNPLTAQKLQLYQAKTMNQEKPQLNTNFFHNNYNSNYNNSINHLQYEQRQPATTITPQIKSSSVTSIPIISGLTMRQPNKQFKTQNHKPLTYEKKPQTYEKGQPSFEKKQEISKYEPFLDKQISSYDFNSFNFSMDTTIKKGQLKLNDSKSQQSIDMKDMLAVLNEKNHKQKHQPKKNQFKFSHNNQRDSQGY